MLKTVKSTMPPKKTQTQTDSSSDSSSHSAEKVTKKNQSPAQKKKSPKVSPKASPVKKNKTAKVSPKASPKASSKTDKKADKKVSPAQKKKSPTQKKQLPLPSTELHEDGEYPTCELKEYTALITYVEHLVKQGVQMGLNNPDGLTQTAIMKVLKEGKGTAENPGLVRATRALKGYYKSKDRKMPAKKSGKRQGQGNGLGTPVFPNKVLVAFFAEKSVRKTMGEEAVKCLAMLFDDDESVTRSSIGKEALNFYRRKLGKDLMQDEVFKKHFGKMVAAADKEANEAYEEIMARDGGIYNKEAVTARDNKCLTEINSETGERIVPYKYLPRIISRCSTKGPNGSAVPPSNKAELMEKLAKEEKAFAELRNRSFPKPPPKPKAEKKPKVVKSDDKPKKTKKVKDDESTKKVKKVKPAKTEDESSVKTKKTGKAKKDKVEKAETVVKAEKVAKKSTKEEPKEESKAESKKSKPQKSDSSSD